MTPSRNRRLIGIFGAVVALAIVALGYAGYRQFFAPATAAHREAWVVEIQAEVSCRDFRVPSYLRG